ncbi:MAG: recombinase RecA [Ignavibacteriales bacterium]|nr:recombinase RecA [Ignavibacteriales bacterium]
MSADKDQRLKILDDTISNIEKQFGKGTIMKLGAGVIAPVESIPTGSLSLDYALGIGGVPRGRVVEIYGPESSGKTTLCLHIIAEAQKKGGLAAFVDAEHALDANYAKRLGVDTTNLLLSQPDFGEQALEIVDTLVRSNALDIIVVDSVAALVPRSEIEGDMGDPQMAMQARLMSQALRKITGAISKSKTCVIFINQLRMKIGVMFGNPETTTGGNALKFYASLRLDIRRIAAIKDGANVIGNRTKVKIAKSKVAPPFKEVEFDILYNEGISKAGDIIDLATSRDILKKSGAWFTYKEDRFQGRDQLRQKMIEDENLFASLERDVKVSLGMIKDEAKPVIKEEVETKTKKTK